MRALAVNSYRMVRRDGITAIIINKGRLLLVKRRALPFIMDPGAWSFATGGRRRGETYDETAYREVEEETGIGRSSLTLLAKRKNVMKFESRKRERYFNNLYIMHSGTRKVRLNIENSDFRWAPFDDVRMQRRYTNVFLNERSILQLLKRVLDEEAAQRQD